MGLRMRIAIASDHAAFDLKADLRDWLIEQGHEVADLGPELVAVVAFGLGCHLACHLEVAVCLAEWATDGEDLLELLEPPAHGPEQVLVAEHLGVGEAPSGLGVFGLEGLDSLQHAGQGSGGVPAP